MNITEKITQMFGEKTSFQPNNTEILKHTIEEFLSSQKRRYMFLGQQYYENHTAIAEKKRLVVGEKGTLVEDSHLSNTKLSHSFLRKINDQKTQYLFGKPFAVNTPNTLYKKQLSKIFHRTAQRDLRYVAKESINKGIAFLQIYFSNGEIRFKKMNSEEIIPLWSDAGHTSLESVIRIYDTPIFDGKKTSLLTKVKWYTAKGVENYLYEKGKITLDPDIPFESHFTLDGEGYNFAQIPFIYFKYNEEEIPLIQYIKPLIDDYDLLTSEDSDTILDQPNSLLVLTNYDGQNLGEFRQNIARYKAVKVSDGGGLEVKSTNVNTQSINDHLSLTRRDIYELGRGVDTQSERVGKATGVALKFLYADLDLDCNGIESEFQSSLSYLMQFVDKYLLLTTGIDYSEEKVEFIFNRRMIINESEAIVDCQNSVGIIDPKIIEGNHPWINFLSDEPFLEKQIQPTHTTQ